jgi:predicted porin
MQRKLIAAAVFASFPLIASAQSSVTIYGIVDAAIERRDTGAANGTSTAVASGNQSGSRIGFRGVEDLGNGLKATFTLESQVNVDTGGHDTNALFGRRAVVGLQGAFGGITVGREYTPVADIAGLSDINGQGLYGTNLSMFGGFGTSRLTRRISNSVNYKSNSLSGFRFGAAYGAGETTTGPSQNLVGFSADYTIGALYVGGAYQTYERLGVEDDKEYIIGAALKFGDFEVKGNWARANMANAVTSGAGFLHDFTQYNIGGSYAVGANKFFTNFQRNELTNGAKGNAWSLGYTYSLSKRTNFYAAYAQQRNNNRANFGLSSGANNVTPTAAQAGADPKVLTAGVRHTF